MSVFRDKRTFPEESESHGPDRSADLRQQFVMVRQTPPESWDQNLPGQRNNPLLAVENRERPRRGFGY